MKIITMTLFYCVVLWVSPSVMGKPHGLNRNDSNIVFTHLEFDLFMGSEM